MSFMPPWFWLLLALLVLSALAGWVLQRGLKKQALLAEVNDVQRQANRQIQQQHLTDLDQAFAEGRLSPAQHAVARDDMLRHVLSDAAAVQDTGMRSPVNAASTGPVRVVWIVLSLAAISGWTYTQLGAAQAWWPLPLSQRVQITSTTPEQLAEQTRAWLQATKTRPGDAQAWLTLARLHAAQNEHALAEQALARVLVLAPENDLWIERAQMKALSAGGVFAGEPWQWIQQVLTAQPQHLNALVLAGSAAWSEKRHDAARAYWQQALGLVPADSEAAQGLQQALAQATEMAKLAQVQASQTVPVLTPTPSGGDTRPLIQGEVRVSPEVQSQIGAGASLFVYAVAEEGSRRPVAIWRGTPTAWPVRFGLSDSMGMGAPPVLSSLAQVRLVARISKTGSAQKQPDDWQVELAGVKTGVQGVVLNITGR